MFKQNLTPKILLAIIVSLPLLLKAESFCTPKKDMCIDFEYKLSFLMGHCYVYLKLESGVSKTLCSYIREDRIIVIDFKDVKFKVRILDNGDLHWFKMKSDGKIVNKDVFFLKEEEF